MSRMIMKRLILSCLSLTLTALAACSDTENPTAAGEPVAGPELATAANSWANRAPLPTSRGYASAAALNSFVYVVGGVAADANRTFKPNLYRYNTSTNSWSTLKPMPVSKAFMNGASFINGKLYVSGGYADGTLYVYTPSTNTWARKANLPSPSWDGAQAVIGGKLYVYTPVKGVGNFWRYNPATNKWSTLPVPIHVHDFPAAGVIDGKFYLAAGGDVYDPSDALDVYNPGTNSWVTKAPMPWRSTILTGGVVNGKLYAVGLDRGVNQAAVYNPSTNTWTTIKPMRTPREGAATAVSGGKLYVIGGEDSSGRATKVVEAYTP